MTTYTVCKRDADGREVLRYTGEIVQRGDRFVCVRAIFQQATVDLGYTLMKQGDIFTEWFYADRWYNVFKLEDVDDGRLKGYYCNLTRPAEIMETQVAADDLALDIFVAPTGQVLLLDADEYVALALSPSERRHVEWACQQIVDLASARSHPFHELP